MKKLTAALWSLLLFLSMGPTFAQETEEPDLVPTISLIPMRGDTVGKNIPVKLTVSTGEVNDEGISFPAEMVYKTKVYYTTDGITVPSENAYNEQADKENGLIKMVENIENIENIDDEEDRFIVDENNMSYMSLTFDHDVRLMAKAYMTMPSNVQDVTFETVLFDRNIKVKAETNPEFLAGDAVAASGKNFAVGDKLIIKNPGSKAKYSEMYFSFDGTEPTRWAYDAQPDAKYDQWHVFKMNGRETEDVEITFCKDEQGLYAHIAEVMGYVRSIDTIRIKDGKFQVMAFCESFIAEGDEDGDVDPGFGPVPTMPFSYGSDFVEAAYTVSETPVVETVAMPEFSVKAGEVEKGTKLEITCATEGATIYYTLTSGMLVEEATEYTEAIVINEDVTVAAWAVKDEIESEVAEATYTVKSEDPSANEDEELAGVTVYPNPSNGLLHISLPVAASIEVFMSNGMLYQRINANAGEVTLNINRSGIYFIRIASEGRATVKRVIIR